MLNEPDPGGRRSCALVADSDGIPFRLWAFLSAEGEMFYTWRPDRCLTEPETKRYWKAFLALPPVGHHCLPACRSN